MTTENNIPSRPEIKNKILDSIKAKANFLINYGRVTGRNSILSIGLIMIISVAGFEFSELSIKKIIRGKKKIS